MKKITLTLGMAFLLFSFSFANSGGNNNNESEIVEQNTLTNSISTKIENQTLHIYSNLLEPDYLISVSSEDGLLHEDIGMKGNVTCNDEVTIDICNWKSGDYFILVQSNNVLRSFYFRIN